MNEILKGFKHRLSSAITNRRDADLIVDALDLTYATVGSVVFTVSAEVADVVTVGIQAKDRLGDNVAAACVLDIHLNAAATGLLFTTAAYDAIAATKGAVAEVVVDKVLRVITHTDGAATLTFEIEDTDTGTTYLTAIGSSGRIIGTSDAITHVDNS